MGQYRLEAAQGRGGRCVVMWLMSRGRRDVRGRRVGG